MKRLIVFLVIVFSLFGCAMTMDTIGNGVLDDTEASDISFFVGLAFVARPDSVEPAEKITDLILEKDLVLAAVDDMGAVIRDLAGEAGFLPAEIEVLVLAGEKVRADIRSRLGLSVLSDLPEVQRYDVGKQIIQIVNESAKARK